MPAQRGPVAGASAPQAQQQPSKPHWQRLPVPADQHQSRWQQQQRQAGSSGFSQWYHQGTAGREDSGEVDRATLQRQQQQQGAPERERGWADALGDQQPPADSQSNAWGSPTRQQRFGRRGAVDDWNVPQQGQRQAPARDDWNTPHQGQQQATGSDLAQQSSQRQAADWPLQKPQPWRQSWQQQQEGQDQGQQPDEQPQMNSLQAPQASPAALAGAVAVANPWKALPGGTFKDVATKYSKAPPKVSEASMLTVSPAADQQAGARAIAAQPAVSQGQLDAEVAGATAPEQVPRPAGAWGQTAAPRDPLLATADAWQQQHAPAHRSGSWEEADAAVARQEWRQREADRDAAAPEVAPGGLQSPPAMPQQRRYAWGYKPRPRPRDHIVAPAPEQVWQRLRVVNLKGWHGNQVTVHPRWPPVAPTRSACNMRALGQSLQHQSCSEGMGVCNSSLTHWCGHHKASTFAGTAPACPGGCC